MEGRAGLIGDEGAEEAVSIIPLFGYGIISTSGEKTLARR